MKISSLISILALLGVLIIAGCISQPKSSGSVAPIINISAEIEKAKTAATTPPTEENASEALKVIRGEDPTTQVSEYLKAHPVAVFPGISNRIIEVELGENRSILRFRTSTPNPRQESIYLLGVQFLVFSDVPIANVTGYNEEGKIIMSPDSRTQEKRSIYWKKYRTQTDWFPNLALQAECKVDIDCNDKSNCTKDLCLPDGFCSNAKIVSTSCP
ncbi:TPA: hypothetical protein H1005_04330 [archaeon]|uniref:Lipoprotein n=1 Tax=Candidatus Naiadarchaeum limnaeum TaxID=2756139 RepID=A0A832V5C0_9ARCH|nr:hypothetical protein [Candidatus Naiadarchaeales archaeon SRR2090153.bin1042]HIK00540.1 hypothetical protein [Candidatus Naiadarchaeum limnaeum]